MKVPHLPFDNGTVIARVNTVLFFNIGKSSHNPTELLDGEFERVAN